VEFAVVLPILLLFFFGVVEVGFAMFSYIRVAGANREAARMASRGRFSDESIARQVVAAGGLQEVEADVFEPNLRTTGISPNTGIIITHVDIPIAAGDPIQTSYYVSGTLTVDGASGLETRYITSDDGRLARLSAEDLLSYLNHRRSISTEIYEYRAGEAFEALEVESYVIVETFYAHETLTDFIPFIGDIVQLYFESTLRVLADSRLD